MPLSKASLTPMESHLVSVIVPAYNCEEYLERAVASCLGQEYVAEVWIGDDASTDGTKLIAQKLARRYPQVHTWFSEVNVGPSAVRNALMEHCQGTWIAVLDGDDIWTPRRLSELMRVSNGMDAVSDNTAEWNGTTVSRNMISIPSRCVSPIRLNSRLALLLNIGWSQPIFRKEFLAEHGLHYNESLRSSEDFDFYLRVLAAGACWTFLPKAGYLYFRHPGSLSKDWRRGLKESSQMLRRLSREILFEPESQQLINKLISAKTAIRKLREFREGLPRRIVDGRAVFRAVKAGIWLLFWNAQKKVMTRGSLRPRH